MRITKIEIAGFKSFRERTGLSLEDGITAIVGPNGCGKSNIIDAIRWALGEQRASALRGGKMSDVIFNGSATARPLGMAEVELTFRVEDEALPAPWDRFAELSVCRRLHRSGESEYLINREPARLKDVQQLFLGTGAGTSTYSIIAQGTVDFIVTARPAERRELIEEAAGISRYKLQRRTTERNLEQTVLNLERAADLLKEVGRQVNSLRQQAARAERYHALVEEERTLGLVAWLGERRTLLETQRAADARQSETRAQIEALEATRAEHVRAVEDARLHVELARRRYDDAVEKALRAEGRRDLLRGTVEHHAAEIDRLEKSLERAERRSAELDERLEAARRETLDVAAQLEGCEAEAPDPARLEHLELERTERRDEVAGLAERLESVRRAQREVERNQTRLRERRDGLSASLTTTRERHGRARTDLDALTEQRDQALRRVDEARARLEAATLAHEDADARLAGGRDELARVAAEAQTAAKAARSAQEHAIRLETRLETLVQSAPRAAEGDHKAPHPQPRAKTRGPEETRGPEKTRPPIVVDPALRPLLVPLGQLIQVAPEREATLAAALDGDLDALVLDATDLDDARVATLAGLERGRVLVLREEAEGTDPGPLPLGAEVLGDTLPQSASPRLPALVRRWLARRLRGVHALDDALAAWRGGAPERGGADPQGWLADAQGALRRTSQGGGLAVLRHTRDLRQVRAELETAREAADAADALRQRADAVRDDASARIEALAEEAQRLRDAMNADRAAEREARLRADALETSVAGVQREATRLGHEVDSLELRLVEVEQELQGLGELGAGTGDELERLAALHEEAARLLAVLDQDASAMGLAKARADARRQALTHAHRQALRSEATLAEERDRLVHSREGQQRALVKSRAEHATAHAELATVSETATRCAGERARAEEARERYEEARLTTEADLATTDDYLRAAREALSNATIEHERCHVALEAVDRQNQERYDLDPDGALEHVGREALRELPADLKERLESVRGRLRGFGDVNTAAVREFDEIRERETFLVTQKEDLEQAVADLREAIRRIDETCRERFAQTFVAVNEEFQKVFPRLFNGGEAKLVLTDPDNLLDTGVEIMAQPPGKRKQTLSLLSGGEKALTAVSLMMALFLLRPAPFCILDEVDAPLDDVNVARFARLLHDLAERSQLLVVTHNRLTMRAADRLYGVTMEQKGVSKLVTVRLDDVAARHAATTVEPQGAAPR